jgi:GNAT superfamily N-acetyltransferase
MSTPSAGHVARRARPGEADRIAEVLARAFDDDPVATYLFPSERSRRKGLRKFFAIQIKHGYMDAGEVWTTDDLAGAALWAPPDKARPGPSDLIRLLPVVPHLIGRRTISALRFVMEIDALRPRERHWYLASIGTEPARQGQGVGSSLLKAVLERCDKEAMPAYLESSKERNVPFYARFGFEVTREIRAPGGGPTLWLMWREPRPADTRA